MGCRESARCCTPDLALDVVDKLSHGVFRLKGGTEALHEVAALIIAIRELGNGGVTSVMDWFGIGDRCAVDG